MGTENRENCSQRDSAERKGYGQKSVNERKIDKLGLL